jgi:hypothetical protein
MSHHIAATSAVKTNIMTSSFRPSVNFSPWKNFRPRLGLLTPLLESRDAGARASRLLTKPASAYLTNASLNSRRASKGARGMLSRRWSLTVSITAAGFSSSSANPSWMLSTMRTTIRLPRAWLIWNFVKWFCEAMGAYHNTRMDSTHNFRNVSRGTQGDFAHGCHVISVRL